MRKIALLIALLLTFSVSIAQGWQPKSWQKYVIEQKVKNDTLCSSGSILIRERMVEPKINSRAFYCGQFYVPDPPSLFAEQERAGWEDRDYTIGQAMGDLFLDFVGDIFAGALDNLLFKKRYYRNNMLEVRNLHATIADKEILKGIDLTVKDGEIHAIMGPNGSGKSTLSAVLTGNPLYTVTDGSAVFNGKDLLEMGPDERANEGIFLSFQYPVEIPGVSMTNFMKAAVNAKRKYQGLEPLKAADFMKLMREKRDLVGLDSKLSHRSVNEGFSGGEKKRNEIFQMAMLQPKLSILDETDSGLDVDAMRIVAEGVNKMHTAETSTIVITHYDRLLDMIKPSVVHILYKGRIVKTGGPELAREIEKRGYDWIKAEVDK